MKRFFTAIGVLASAFALSLGAASAAAAVPAGPADAPMPAPPRTESAAHVVPSTAVEQRTCRARFTSPVNLRSLAGTEAAVLDVVPAETWVQVSCERGSGGEYRACGLTSDYWMEVYWNGAWGYSAWSCVKDWEYTS